MGFVVGCLRLRGVAKSIDVATLIYEQRWLAKKLTSFMQILAGAASPEHTASGRMSWASGILSGDWHHQEARDRSPRNSLLRDVLSPQGATPRVSSRKDEKSSEPT